MSDIDGTPRLGSGQLGLRHRDDERAGKAQDNLVDHRVQPRSMAAKRHQSTLLVVDDEPDLRHNLCQWLAASGYDVLTAGNAAEAMALVRSRPIDVVVTDLRMPGLDGIALLGLIKAWSCDIDVIILTGQGTMQDAIAALREGRAFDFLLKPLDDMRQLNIVIERALSRRSAAPLGPGRQPTEAVRLSPRDRELLSLLVRGLENRQIADLMSLSEGTVRNRLSRLYQRLDVENRTQAVVAVRDLGLDLE
jgi:DNA-binding NarL/FixJ family response regulator